MRPRSSSIAPRSRVKISGHAWASSRTTRSAEVTTRSHSRSRRKRSGLLLKIEVSPPEGAGERRLAALPRTHHRDGGEGAQAMVQNGDNLSRYHVEFVQNRNQFLFCTNHELTFNHVNGPDHTGKSR